MVRAARFLTRQHISIRNAGVEGDAQTLVVAAGGSRKSASLAHDEHGRAKAVVALHERIDLVRDLQALAGQRLSLLRRIGQRKQLASLLERRRARKVGARRGIRAAHAALVHDALVLLLQLDEHAPVTLRFAVPTHAKLFLVQRLFDAARDQVAGGGVEIQAGDARTAEFVFDHATFDGPEHGAMLRRI